MSDGEVYATTNFDETDGGNADAASVASTEDQIYDMNVKEKVRKNKSSAAGTKKRRGRPRKVQFSDSEAEGEAESDVAVQVSSAGATGEGAEQSTGGGIASFFGFGGSGGTGVPVDEDKRPNMVRIIKELKKKLGAVGSGMEPTLAHSEAQLQAEIDLLNEDLNGKRGEKVVKSMVLGLAPILEMVVARLVPPQTMDLSSTVRLRDEMENNWEVLEEAATHLAILHGDWFTINPYWDLGNGIMACVSSCNMKNQAARRNYFARMSNPAPVTPPSAQPSATNLRSSGGPATQ